MQTENTKYIVCSVVPGNNLQIDESSDVAHFLGRQRRAGHDVLPVAVFPLENRMAFLELAGFASLPTTTPLLDCEWLLRAPLVPSARSVVDRHIAKLPGLIRSDLLGALRRLYESSLVPF